jgi:hypothetical protein
MIESVRVPNRWTVVLRPWRELAILASVLMDLSWAILFYRLVFPAGIEVSYERDLLVLAALMLVSYVLVRTIDYLNLDVRARWGLLAGLYLASVLVGLKTLLASYHFQGILLAELLSRPARTFQDMLNLVPTEFVLMVVLFWVWSRGISFAYRQVGPTSVIAGFRTGLVAFLVYGLALPLAGEAARFSTGSPGILALPVFLFSSLLAMSAARISILSHLRGGQRIPFDRRWLAGIVLVVLAVSGLSILAAGLMLGNGYHLIYQVYTWVVYILVILLSPLLLLFMRLIILIGQWINLAGILQSVIRVFSEIQAGLQRWLEWIEELLGGIELAWAAGFFRSIMAWRGAILWGVILVAVTVVVLTLRGLKRENQDEGGDEQASETLLKGGSLKDLLRSMLNWRWKRKGNPSGRIWRLRRAEQMLAAARIRRIYAQLLNLSARLGQPRPAPRTPLEFLPDLERLFPALSADLGTVTRAYLRVRYGELSESWQEVEAVESAWKRIAQEGQAQIAARGRRSG